VRALLRHFEAVGFHGAPRLLGIDDRGRDVLSYLDGDVYVGPDEVGDPGDDPQRRSARECRALDP
jgi:hypothetical protein